MKKSKQWLCLMLAFSMLLSCLCFADETEDTSSDLPEEEVVDTSSDITEDVPSDISDTANEPDPSDGSAVSVPVSGNTGDFSDVDYKTPLGQSLDTLTDKAIISGFPDGTYKPDQTLTRAEFAKIIVCFLGSDVSVDLPTGFPDVDDVGGSAHWARAYIRVAKDLSIISGFPDGTFHPDEPVTYEQATKMIMCALGFTQYEYPQGFIQIAMQKKLFTNSTHQGASSLPVNRGATAILVYNALSISPNNTAVNVSGGGSFSFSGGGSSKSGGGGGGGGSEGSSYTRRITGVVFGNATTMLNTSSSLLDEDEIALRYESKGQMITETLPVAAKYQKNLAKYLGQNVRVSLSENDDGEEYVAELSVLDTKNYVKTVDVSDFISFEKDAEDVYTLSYYDGNNKASLKFNTAENIYLLYNGKSICTDEADAYVFDPSYIQNVHLGSFTMTSNDGDRRIDVISVTSYATSIVNSRNTSTEIIKCKYGDPDIDVSTRNRTVSITNAKTYKDYSLSDLKVYDIVDYCLSKDGQLLTVLVSPASTSANVITGNITAITDETVKIKTSDSKTVEYDLNYNYLDYYQNFYDEDKYEPQKEDKVKLHLNSFGKVAAIEPVISSADEKYGYIINLGYESNKPEPQDEDDRVILRLYVLGDSRGTTRDIPLSSGVRIDGNIYKKRPEDVTEVIKAAARVANEGKTSSPNAGLTYASFIRFEQKDGSITMIDTLLDAFGNPSTKSDEQYNQLWRSSFVYNENEALGGRHKYRGSSPYGFYKTSTSELFKTRSSNTTVLFVPGNRAAKSLYSSSKFATSNFHHGMEYYVEAYNLDKQGYAQYMLQFLSDGKSDVSAWSTPALITAVETEDETGTNRIRYYDYNGSAKTIKISADSPAENKFADLHVGDMILFSNDTDGTLYDYFYSFNVSRPPTKRIDSYDLVYNTGETNDRRIKGFDLYPTDDPQDTEYKARYRTLYGTAVSYDKGTGYLEVNPALSTDYLEPDRAYTETLEVTSSTRVFVLDQAEKTITPYTSSTAIKEFLSDELITAKNNGGDYDGCDHLIAYSNNTSTTPSATTTNLRFIYIIHYADAPNPANYPGVETPAVDPLADVKRTAKQALGAYARSTDYMYASSLFETIIANGRTAISRATTQAEIDEALDAAYEELNALASDSDRASMRLYIDSYINYALETHPSITSEINQVAYDLLPHLDPLYKTAELDSVIEAIENALDALMLAADKESFKEQLDAYVAETAEANGYDLTADNELALLLASLKTAIDDCADSDALDEAIGQAYTQLTAYLQTTYAQ